MISLWCIVKLLFLQYALATYIDDDDGDGRHDNGITGNDATYLPSASIMPSLHPSLTTSPSNFPTIPPPPSNTKIPSSFTSNLPSIQPSKSPSISPTNNPSPFPSALPSNYPSTASPSTQPSTSPSSSPTKDPSLVPSALPSNYPSSTSSMPSTRKSGSPTKDPSLVPSALPSNYPSTASPSIQPSTSPSSSPTKDPSLVPSNLPSNYPSIVIPPIQPSTSPSISLTKDPSLVPSALPSNPPSTASSAPSASLSSSPTKAPSPIPSALPSNSPSTVSLAPSTSLCQLNSAGFYGSQTANSIPINYKYAMIYSESSNNVSQILEELEYAISDILMESTISECNASKMTEETQGKIELEDLMGISSTPKDVDTGNCESSLSGNNTRCSIIDGQLTLYLRNIGRILQLSSNESFIPKFAEIISNDMDNDNGELVSSHSAIIELIYIGDRNITNVPVTGVNDLGEDSELSTIRWISVTCATVFFFVTAGFIGRTVVKKAAENDREDSDSNENGYDVEVNGVKHEIGNTSSIHDDSTVDFS